MRPHLFALPFLLAACDPAMVRAPSTAPTPNEVAAAAIPPRQGARTYLCSDGRAVRAEYPEDDGPLSVALVDFGEGRTRMIQATSASGVRYIGGGWQWWTRGGQLASLAPLGPNESLASAPGVECRSNG